jgi:anti-anti-sigma factor
MSRSSNAPPATKSAARCAHCGELVGEHHAVYIVEADEDRWSTLAQESKPPDGMVFHTACLYAVKATTARQAWHRGGPVPGEHPRNALRVEVVANARRRGLVLHGELDMSTYGVFEEAVEQACARGPAEVVVSLRDLSFVDTTGIRALLAARDYCRAHNCRYFIDPDLPAPLERMLTLMGLQLPVERLPAGRAR